MDCQAKYGDGSSIYRDKRLKHLVRPHASPINDDLEILLRLDLQAMMKLSEKAASHKFFARVVINALIRYESPDTL
jgi:hypothetical protein